MSSSAQHHKTFCTLDELARPQIFSIASLLASSASWSLRFLESATTGASPGVCCHSSFQPQSRQEANEPSHPRHSCSRTPSRHGLGEPARRRGGQKLEGDG